MRLFGLGPENVNPASLVPRFIRINEKNPQKQNSFGGLFGSSNPDKNIFNQPKNDVFERSTKDDNPPKRLNGLDSNILTDQRVDEFIPVASFRIERKLDKAEKQLEEANEELKFLKFLKLDQDMKRIVELELKREKLEEEIQKYREQYRDLGLAYKAVDIINVSIIKVRETFDKTKAAFAGNLLVLKAKSLIPGMKEKEDMKQTLLKVNLLHNSISNMLSKTTNPFGESEKQMNQFVAFMGKANQLNLKLNKFSNSTNPFTKFFKDKYDKTATFLGNLKGKVIPKQDEA